LGFLKTCLRSIFEQTHSVDYEVIVVDNASTDGSLATIANDFPHIKLIINVDNLGFAAGNNV
jgi:GT2 family glycosyltransferase